MERKLSDGKSTSEADKLEAMVESVYKELSSSNSTSDSTAQILPKDLDSPIKSFPSPTHSAAPTIMKNKIEISVPDSSLKDKLIIRIFYHMTLIDQILGVLASKRFSNLLTEFFLNKKTNLDLSQFWLFINISTNTEIFSKFCFNFLGNHFFNLQKLSLAHCKFLNDKILFSILKNLKKESCAIKGLNLYCCENITDESLNALLELHPNIKSLTLARCNNLTFNGIRNLIEKMKCLNFLSIMHIRHLPLQIVELSADSANLKTMDVRGCFSDNKENHNIIEQYIKNTSSKCKIIYKSGKGSIK